MVSQLISMVNWNIGQNVTVNNIKSLKKIHMTSTMISFYLNVWNILSYNFSKNYSQVCYDWINWIHLSMKEGSLFLSFCNESDPRNWDASDRILGQFRKLSKRRGASAGFHGVWTCGVKVLKYWMISSLKIKINRCWKFQRNWIVPLVLLERSWWAGFDGISLIRFGFSMWEILIYKQFLLLEIQMFLPWKSNVHEYSMISSLKIKLNRSWKF
jgi:hypothetical protein